MNEHTDKRIDEILASTKAQSDLVSGLFGLSAVTAARLETILSIQRELLVKLGLDRQKVNESVEQTFVKHLAAAHKEMQQSLSSALKTDESKEPPPESTGGHHRN